MNIRLKTLITISALVLVYALYYWVIPPILNVKKHVGVIENLVLKQTGYKIAIDNPRLKMGLNPAIWLFADDFAVLNNDNSKALTIQNPKIKINLIPFLIGKTHIKYFSATSVSANLGYDKNAHWKLGNYVLMELSDSKISINNSKIILDNYIINVDDELQQKKIVITGDYFNLNKYIANKHIGLATAAKILVGKEVSTLQADLDFMLQPEKNANHDIKLDATVTNLNLNDFSPYLRKIADSSAGIVNLELKTTKMSKNNKKITSHVVLDDFHLRSKDPAKSIYSTGRLNLKAETQLVKNNLTINDFSLTGDKLNFFIKGTVAEIFSKNPQLDLTTTIRNSRIERFITLLPAIENLGDEINFYALKKYGYYSDLNGTLRIEGATTTPAITGKILSTEGYVIKPISNSPKATIIIAFQGGDMTMDITVPAFLNQTVWVKGEVELYGKKRSHLKITSTQDVDLKTAQNVLMPLYQIFKFLLGPVPIMDIQGLGNIDLDVTGGKKEPRAFGAFNFHNATVSFNDVHNMVVTDGAGTLKFDNIDTHFVTTKGFLNGKPIKIDGRCSLYGKLDFDVTAPSQDLADLVKIVNTSPMLADIRNLTDNFIDISGSSNFVLKLTGEVKDINDFAFGKNIFASGEIALLGDKILPKGLKTPLTKTIGKVTFKNLDATVDITSQIGDSPISVIGSIKDNDADIKVAGDKFKLYDAIAFASPKINFSEIEDIVLNFSATYKGNVDTIDYNNIILTALMLPSGKIDHVVLQNGIVKLNHSNLRFENFQGAYRKNPFTFSAVVNNTFDKNPTVNADILCRKLDLTILNILKNKQFIKKHVPELKDTDNFGGYATVSAQIKNNKLNAKISPVKAIFRYKPFNIPIRILSGDLEIKNNVLILNKINAILDHMPLLADGKISNIFAVPMFNIYVNSKPTQDFIEKYFNRKTLYPLKIKGDIISSSKFTGTRKSMNIKSDVSLEAGSEIYYMGATLGDKDTPIKIASDFTVTGNSYKVNSFEYDKYLVSQNNKAFKSPLLKASGHILSQNNNFYLNNFKIKTENLTDAKIFNILFKKPTIKQGNFTSDITLNGYITAPIIRGKADFYGMDIPFFDSTIQNISVNFKENDIDLISNGEIFGNKILLDATIKNKFSEPYIIEKLNLEAENLNINRIASSMKDLEVEADKNKISATKQPFNLSQVEIRNSVLKADKITIRNIDATNLHAHLTLNDKMFLNMDEFKFNTAQGSIKGNFSYNLLNKTTKINMNFNQINANMLSQALFDLPNQMFGSLNGEMSLVCNGTSHKRCMETLTGSGGFDVKSGRMPKLGSLEYLLRASNVVKSGLTGLSINGLIDLVSPLKTGEFDTIHGTMNVEKGVAESIQIFSKGKDLSMFLTGTYNFSTLVADMKIFGRLYKKANNALGAVGNASLNSLFNAIPGINLKETDGLINEINKIPGIELNDKDFRIFLVEILGDLNGENFVQSFKWVD